MALTRITKGVIKPNENYDTHNINSTGIVTAIGLDVNGNGDISGNLNVGGVLTYEDVTSIDSVGIITAQKDIHVGAGVSVVGIVTAATFKGDGDFVDIDVDGHTNLDNVSIAGVTTITGSSTSTLLIKASTLNGTAKLQLQDSLSRDNFIAVEGADNLLFAADEGNAGADSYMRFKVDGTERLRILNTGATVTGTLVATGADINGDIDVDGHTNLDNVSVAGVTTFSDDVKLTVSNGTGILLDKSANQFLINVGTNVRFQNNNEVNTDDGKIGTALFASGLNIVGSQTGSGLGRQIRLYGDLLTNNIQPTVDSTYSIGTSSNRFLHTYLDNLDVDGHTNLDNVSIAGVTTFAQPIRCTSSSTSVFTGGIDFSQANVTSGNITFVNNRGVLFGSGNPFQIYHNSGTSIIEHNGTGSLDIMSRSGEYAMRAYRDGAVELYYDNNKKFETFSAGISVTGQVNSDGSHMGDGDKALFGNSNDLQIYHDGTHSYIDNNTGNLIIKADGQGLKLLSEGNIILRDNDDSTNMIRCINGGQVELYHAGTKKFETTSTGVQVTGTGLALNVNGGYIRSVGGQPTVVAHKSSSTFCHIGVENNSNARAFLAYTNDKDFCIGRRSAYTGDHTGYNGVDITIDKTNHAVSLSYNGGTRFATTNEGATFSTGSTSCVVRLTSNNSSEHVLQAYNNDLNIKAPSSGGISLITNGSSERLRIKSDGRIDVGGNENGYKFNIIDESNRTTTAETALLLYAKHDGSGTTGAGFGTGIRFWGDRASGNVEQNMGRIMCTAEVNSGTTLSGQLSFDTSVAGSLYERLRIKSTGVIEAKTLAGSYYPIASARDGSTSARAATSAWEIKKTLGPRARNGYYYLINPYDGTTSQWWCDMTTDGGGWILIAHTGEGTMADQGAGGAHWYSRNNKGGFNSIGSGYYTGGGYWRATNGAWGENTCGQLMWDVRTHQSYYDNYANSKVVFNWNTDQALPAGTSNYSNIPNASSRKFNDWCYEVVGAPGFNPSNYHQNARNNTINGGNYFTEHMVMTWSFRGTGGGDDDGESGPYWMIGAHANGRHQHYEESLSGDSTGNGKYQVVSNEDTAWGNGGDNSGYPRLARISNNGTCNVWLR